MAKWCGWKHEGEDLKTQNTHPRNSRRHRCLLHLPLTERLRSPSGWSNLRRQQQFLTSRYTYNLFFRGATSNLRCSWTAWTIIYLASWQRTRLWETSGWCLDNDACLQQNDHNHQLHTGIHTSSGKEDRHEAFQWSCFLRYELAGKCIMLLSCLGHD